ncbi:hypothetical protein ILYODFUR_027938 [Ilyodon furcidens]|uniref:Uncharacterized protein n=1 Tax=Ilyodon furcidens TaxID=33524 RepID=A0ABV0TCU0_9TELE
MTLQVLVQWIKPSYQHCWGTSHQNITRRISSDHFWSWFLSYFVTVIEGLQGPETGKVWWRISQNSSGEKIGS